ncbi:MAG: diphosphomevalonate decarboxylase [Deltaproteobacteria bacterium]|nr:MAG: diphosphomevalonate decarboxylase [Deltaproteobacteria bacterium]TMA84698.1 MAG: diphosphomevalonate decarboxylase [Deltaproteobacteria bacterium]TMB11601.1 MAG: diphosphomevalonate decarboxylase [Deltaproteobacteria bacterium]
MLAAGTTARANVNVALVKYWGKRDPELNLPATGSISLTLEGLSVEARVAFGEHATDRIEIDGGPARGEEAARVTHFLDVLRREAGRHERADVVTRSTVPRGIGLASSAAAFAALALAGSRAAGLRLEPPALSALARRGSGSAARSIFGGFVEWRRGERKDGRDSVASSLATTDGWDIRVVIAVTASAPKVVSSRAGMTRALSSPLYPAWVASVEADLDEARAAIRARDFEALGLLAEHSALKMHAIGLAARPALLYWRGATIECMHRVWALRAEGTAAFFTIDAGPQVKVLCQTAAADRVVEVLRDTPGVERILTCAPGGGAEVLA